MVEKLGSTIIFFKTSELGFSKLSELGIKSIELGAKIYRVRIKTKTIELTRFYRVRFLQILSSLEFLDFWRVSLVLFLIVYRVRISVAIFLRVTLPKFL